MPCRWRSQEGSPLQGWCTTQTGEFSTPLCPSANVWKTRGFSLLDGPSRHRLRQRAGGELRSHAKDGASLPQRLAHPPGSEETAIFEFTEGFNNPRRRHSALGSYCGGL